MKRAWNMYLDAWAKDPIEAAIGTVTCGAAFLIGFTIASIVVMELIAS